MIVVEHLKFYAACPHCNRKQEIPQAEASLPLDSCISGFTVKNMLAHMKSNHPDKPKILGIMIETRTEEKANS